MKSLALFCLGKGFIVSGSDIRDCPELSALAEKGVRVYAGHDPEFAASRSLVVYTAAIPADDPELCAARANKVLCMERKAFLALIGGMFDHVAAVAGTHGKTTATAMLCAVMRGQGRSFVGHIGGDCVGGECDSGGGSEWFVTEACEYNRTFLALRPTVAVVLNIAFDHPDCYRDEAEMREAFGIFADNIEKGGTLIAERSEAAALARRGVAVKTFGYSSECDYGACNVAYENGFYSFDVVSDGKVVGRCALKVRGKHNILNALAAIAAAEAMGCDASEACRAISGFRGVRRRFEFKGKLPQGADVYSDYAHHPDEIAAAIDTARVMTKGRITAVFEPHTFSRTKSLIEEFSECFYWADEVMILPTYAAREKPKEGGSAYDLYMKIKKKRRACLYIEDYAAAAEYLVKHAQSNGIVLLLGAGNVERVWDEVRRIKSDGRMP